MSDFSAEAEVLNAAMAGSRVIPAEFVFVVADSIVRLVFDAMAVTVRVSGVEPTVMRSPTLSSVRKSVPTPVRVVLAAGSAVPVIVEDAVAVK
jgi:hypothetical protein